MASEDIGVWEALILGIVQGLTEWFPVSSSGHLVLAQAYLGIEPPLFFDAMVHVATLLVVLVYYRQEVASVLSGLARAPREVAASDQRMRTLFWTDPGRRLATLVVLGSLPAIAVGLTFRTQIEALFGSTFAVAVAMLVTGTVLWWTRSARAQPMRRDLTWRDSLLIGSAQALAILPGISRSGMTISTALFRDVERATAARFSFLLAAPAIAGAAVLQSTSAEAADLTTAWPVYVVGMLAAGLVGYATLRLLVRMVSRGRIHLFAWYCWAVGLLVIIATFAQTPA